jgi:phage tail-like protein
MPNDVYTDFNFRVEISGMVEAGFQECSGLSATTDVIEYREGGDFRVRKIPGLTRFGPIVLKRGISSNNELWNWRKAVIDGNTDRRAGSIILLDEKRQEVKRWNFHEGWPSKWVGPHLRALSHEIAIEELEITCERIELA